MLIGLLYSIVSTDRLLALFDLCLVVILMHLL